jgi:hypothetical protein
MARQYGTLDVLAELDAQAAFQTAASFGEDRLYDYAERTLAIHNGIVNELTGEFVEPTTLQQEQWGTINEGEFIEVDEYGRSDSQAVEPTPVANGYPLRLFDYSVQWTRKWFQNHRVSEWTNQMRSARTADVRNIIRAIKRAIFTATNNTGYKDRLVNNLPYTLRAFLNGDGRPIPPQPDTGAAFASNHTHFIVAAALNTAALDALINLILEHGVAGQIRVCIAQAQEATVRALTGFQPYVDSRLTLSGNTTRVEAPRVDMYRVNNRAIGIYGAAEIWVKPWIVPSYAWAYDTAPTRKPLRWRTREGEANQAAGDLVVAANDERYPLRAETLEREFGIGVGEPSNGGVLFIDAGGVYVTPTITL